MSKTCIDCSRSDVEFEARRNQCKPCRSKYKLKWDQENKERVRYNKLVHKYGVNKETFEEMLADQNGGCKTCGYSSPKHHLSVDHCHATGKVRGLLCPHCNSALGYAKDSIRVLANLIIYLRDSEAGAVE